MTERLTPRTLDLEVRGSSLARRVDSLDKEFYSTLPLFAQMYNGYRRHTAGGSSSSSSSSSLFNHGISLTKMLFQRAVQKSCNKITLDKYSYWNGSKFTNAREIISSLSVLWQRFIDFSRKPPFYGGSCYFQPQYIILVQTNYVLSFLDYRST